MLERMRVFAEIRLNLSSVEQFLSIACGLADDNPNIKDSIYLAAKEARSSALLIDHLRNLFSHQQQMEDEEQEHLTAAPGGKYQNQNQNEQQQQQVRLDQRQRRRQMQLSKVEQNSQLFTWSNKQTLVRGSKCLVANLAKILYLTDSILSASVRSNEPDIPAATSAHGMSIETQSNSGMPHPLGDTKAAGLSERLDNVANYSQLLRSFSELSAELVDLGFCLMRGSGGGGGGGCNNSISAKKEETLNKNKLDNNLSGLLFASPSDLRARTTTTSGAELDQGRNCSITSNLFQHHSKQLAPPNASSPLSERQQRQQRRFQLHYSRPRAEDQELKLGLELEQQQQQQQQLQCQRQLELTQELEQVRQWNTKTNNYEDRDQKLETQIHDMQTLFQVNRLIIDRSILLLLSASKCCLWQTDHDSWAGVSARRSIMVQIRASVSIIMAIVKYSVFNNITSSSVLIEATNLPLWPTNLSQRTNLHQVATNEQQQLGIESVVDNYNSQPPNKNNNHFEQSPLQIMNYFLQTWNGSQSAHDAINKLQLLVRPFAQVASYKCFAQALNHAFYLDSISKRHGAVSSQSTNCNNNNNNTSAAHKMLMLLTDYQNNNNNITNKENQQQLDYSDCCFSQSNNNNNNQCYESTINRTTSELPVDFMLMSRRQLIGALNGLFLGEVKSNLIERAQEFTDCAYTKHEHRQTILLLIQCLKFQLIKFVKLIYRLRRKTSTISELNLSQLRQWANQLDELCFELKYELQTVVIEQSDELDRCNSQLDLIKQLKQNCLAGDIQRTQRTCLKFTDQCEQLVEVCKMLNQVAPTNKIKVTTKTLAIWFDLNVQQLIVVARYLSLNPRSRVAKDCTWAYLQVWCSFYDDFCQLARQLAYLAHADFNPDRSARVESALREELLLRQSNGVSGSQLAGSAQGGAGVDTQATSSPVATTLNSSNQSSEVDFEVELLALAAAENQRQLEERTRLRHLSAHHQEQHHQHQHQHHQNQHQHQHLVDLRSVQSARTLIHAGSVQSLDLLLSEAGKLDTFSETTDSPRSLDHYDGFGANYHRHHARQAALEQAQASLIQHQHHHQRMLGAGGPTTNHFERYTTQATFHPSTKTTTTTTTSTTTPPPPPPPTTTTPSTNIDLVDSMADGGCLARYNELRATRASAWRQPHQFSGQLPLGPASVCQSVGGSSSNNNNMMIEPLATSRLSTGSYLQQQVGPWSREQERGIISQPGAYPHSAVAQQRKLSAAAEQTEEEQEFEDGREEDEDYSELEQPTRGLSQSRRRLRRNRPQTSSQGPTKLLPPLPTPTQVESIEEAATTELENNTDQQSSATETDKWSDLEADAIVRGAKETAQMALSMYQFTKGEGDLNTTQDLFTQAELFAEGANELYKEVRCFSYKVPAGDLKRELLTELGAIPALVQQLQFIVKNPTVGKPATFAKVDGVIRETQTLMEAVNRVVTATLSCRQHYKMAIASMRKRTRTLSPSYRNDKGGFEFDNSHSSARQSNIGARHGASGGSMGSEGDIT